MRNTLTSSPSPLAGGSPPAAGVIASGAGATTATVSLPGHVFAAPAAAASPGPASVTGIGQITLSLCLVLAAILAFAWVARRLRGSLGFATRQLDIIADVRLGPKERAVVLQVGGQQLLLGVAPGSISALHVLPENLPTGPAAQPSAKVPNFAELLRRSLGK